MTIEKRFPADTTLAQETFLNDKFIDGELYAYLQSISSVVDGKTIVLKSKVPTQSRMCAMLGIKSPKTYKTHFDYMISKGYIIDEGNEYELPDVENIYLKIPLPTLKYLTDNCQEHVIKIYIYLGQRYKYGLSKGSEYVFTAEEIGDHIGIKTKNCTRSYEIINNALLLLQNSGLIEYRIERDGRTQRKVLKGFSFVVKR